MPRTGLNFGLVLGVLACTACTNVSVNKLPRGGASTEDGIRFSLPMPLFQATPTAEGGLEVAALEVPDPDATFAISAWSFLATHKLEVATTKGVLETVTWNPDSSAVLARAAKATGAVGAKVIEADLEAAATRSGQEFERKKAIDAAELEYDQADAEVKLLERLEGVDPKVLLAARVALEKARVKRDRLRASAPPAADFANAPGGRGVGSSGLKATGPAFFAIREWHDEDGQLRVALVPAAAQRTFDVGAIRDAPPRVADQVPIVLDGEKNKALSRVVSFTEPVLSIKSVELQERPLGRADSSQVQVALVAGKPQLVNITARPGLATGKYAILLTFEYRYAGMPAEQEEQVRIDLDVSRTEE